MLPSGVRSYWDLIGILDFNKFTIILVQVLLLAFKSSIKRNYKRELKNKNALAISIIITK